MKKKINVVLLSIAVAMALLLAPRLSQRGFVLAQNEQIQIELAAKKYEYSPSPVQVKAGTKVRLKITATDHDHGFKVTLVPDGSATEQQTWASFCFIARLLAAPERRNNDD